ncbi:xanthine dehydrogenase YagR molybdenum-binding subunit [Hoeflea marina]|uniref:Xanthine dehydrogenase YagR molybdenum-binding subunit n=1 Tax=Hoeflea marina TaxID=274592 RepID=A0A317PJ12_9HYPH|nr:xanthine dehydrogenase family protein molybdopterin-binding subunit [Hoeflea marina]PWW00334.1 xanthine dehydrogenase YagR molybdenum-binding subunit [Hoeflea marina]
MTAYLKMDEPDRRNRLDSMAQGVIGQPLDRMEGPLKVSGTARYAHEWPVERLCHAVLVRSTIARGHVVRIDRSPVEAMDGVLAVIDDDRLLRNPAQGTAGKAPVQGPREIFYVGQPLALVVAESFEQARHAATQLRIETMATEAVLDPESESTDRERPEGKQTSQGDLDRAMAEASHSIDAVYHTPGHSSAAMEPHAAIAQWDGDDLTVHASCQMLKYNQEELADALGIDAGRVRIVSPYVGGGFGSKLGIAHDAVAAAIAARAVGRPVALALSRRQVFETTMRRSESRQRIRLAADADGLLTGLGHEALVSQLPGETFSEPVAQATHFLYAAENREIIHEIVRLNRTCAGSVRAPGEAIGMTVLETAMDELAVKAGIDPVALRKRNIPDKDPEDQRPFSSHMLDQALDRGAELFDWQRRRPEPRSTRRGEWLIGLGMSSAARVNSLMQAESRVTLGGEGVRIETDMTDIGTGTYTVLAQIAGEMLGVPMDRITTVLGDTDLPPGPGSGGSWGASSTGSAVYVACEEIRARIARKLGCRAEDLTLKDGHAITGNRSTALGELIGDAPISVRGVVEPGGTSKKVRQSTYGAFFAEVAVNDVTAEVRVRRMLGVFAAGRILNAKTARSQCLGGMTFGIGMALTEELIHDPRDGSIVNRDLAEYHLPVNADVPQLEVELLEERDPWASPIQAKGIGELGISGAAACINNAVFNACGVRVRSYPVTLDKILAEL